MWKIRAAATSLLAKHSALPDNIERQIGHRSNAGISGNVHSLHPRSKLGVNGIHRSTEVGLSCVVGGASSNFRSVKKFIAM